MSASTAAAAGALVTALSLGLRDALGGPRSRPAVVVDHAGDPPQLEPLTLFFHPSVPEATLVLVRRPGLSAPPA
jgi:hypothetical protein